MKVRQALRAGPGGGVRCTSITSSPGLQALTLSATVTLNVPAGSGLQVKLVDQKHQSDPAWDLADATKKGDYRWIIEEDRTILIDPASQTNTGASIRNVGTNFPTSYMPVVFCEFVTL